MKSNQKKPARRPETYSERDDARPLIQAILLGVGLAVALTAAAAMANQDLETKMSDPVWTDKMNTLTPKDRQSAQPHP